MQVDKHFHRFTKPYYEQCMQRKNTRLSLDARSIAKKKNGNEPQEIEVIHTGQAASILFLEAIRKSGINSYSTASYLQVYVNGDGVIKSQSHSLTCNAGCSQIPQVINNMFCIGYGIYYIQPSPMNLGTLCIDARTGKRYNHPFATIDDTLTRKEILALHSYFLRDYCSRISYYKNTIKDLPNVIHTRNVGSRR